MISRETYDFEYAERSPFGHAVQLIQETVRTGSIVLDVGGRFGTIARAVTDAGFMYVGVDPDPRAVEVVHSRGFEAHVVELESDGLADRLVEVAAGRPVGVLTLLDVVEHVPDPGALFDAVGAAGRRLSFPSLVVSVPNIGHFDIAAKLLLGRFDVSELGLLDRTHIQLFTERRLLDMLGPRGFVQLAERDFTLVRSDQHFPGDLPSLSAGSSLYEFLLGVRLAADDTAHVNQFVRSFVQREQLPPERLTIAEDEFDVSVIVRTQGRRSQNLMELLTCLAGQTHDRFEVLLTVHSSDLADVDATRQLIGQFDFGFSRRVRVEQVVGGSRGRPLNVGIEASRGRYVAFVDDDDLVTADWVEAFALGSQTAPGKIIRSITVERDVRRTSERELEAATVIEGPVRFTFAPAFDFVEHCFANSTPICAFAVPKALISALRISFDEHVAVQEDWHFLMRCASYADVHDTGAITAIYHRWAELEGSRAVVDEQVWLASRDLVLHEFDVRPILLPPGAVRSIVAIRGELEGFRAGDLVEEQATLRRLLVETQAALAHERRMAEQFLADAKSAFAEVNVVTSSRSWRVTKPLRALQRLRSRRSSSA